MESITINNEQIEAAYNAAENNDIKGVLNALFGEKYEQDKCPVTERIKTFEDAVRELGDNNPLVLLYNVFTEEVASVNSLNDDADVLAYLKLRIVVAALNEGWTPEFVEVEYRWAPWFGLYTNAEIDRMNEAQKASICRVVGRSSVNADAHGGLAFASSNVAASSSSSNYGARLAFKSQELAEYAGRQFIHLYRDLIIAQ
ncbi:MAG: hypothetical protein IJ760_01025 [Bacteroidales bacterium]|nr:hypothetical protein [Bacteroidales bacterium]